MTAAAAARRVLVTFNRPPHATHFHSEGLRMALGLAAGLEEHHLEIVYLGDGVTSALAQVARAESQRHLSTLLEQGVRPKVEREALEERGIGAGELAAEFEVISRRDVLRLIRESELTIDF